MVNTRMASSSSVSNGNKTLFAIGVILLFLTLPPSIVLGPLGLSRLITFQSERSSFLGETYGNSTEEVAALFTNTSDAINQLEFILMQLTYGLDNLTTAFANVNLPPVSQPTTSMIMQGTLRWKVTVNTQAITNFNLLSPMLPNSTYRAYISYLDGLAFYVIALDTPMLNGPVVVSGSGFFFLHAVLDVPTLWNFTGSSISVILPNGPRLLVNTTQCDQCSPLPAAVYLEMTGTRVSLSQDLVSRSVTGPDIYFNVPNRTNFYFFR